jgi:hypothetical protein
MLDCVPIKLCAGDRRADISVQVALHLYSAVAAAARRCACGLPHAEERVSRARRVLTYSGGQTCLARLSPTLSALLRKRSTSRRGPRRCCLAPASEPASEATHATVWCTQGLIVDLDNNTITKPTTLQELPWRLSWRLLDCIIKVQAPQIRRLAQRALTCLHAPQNFNFFQQYHRGTPIHFPENLPEHVRWPRSRPRQPLSAACDAGSGSPLRRRLYTVQVTSQCGNGRRLTPGPRLHSFAPGVAAVMTLRTAETLYSDSDDSDGGPDVTPRKPPASLRPSNAAINVIPEEPSETSESSSAAHRRTLSPFKPPFPWGEGEERPLHLRSPSPATGFAEPPSPTTPSSAHESRAASPRPSLPFVSRLMNLLHIGQTPSAEQAPAPTVLVQRETAMRKGFMRLFVSLIKGYRHYINLPRLQSKVATRWHSRTFLLTACVRAVGSRGYEPAEPLQHGRV